MRVFKLNGLVRNHWYHAWREILSDISKPSTVDQRFLRSIVENSFDVAYPLDFGEDYPSSNIVVSRYRMVNRDVYQINYITWRLLPATMIEIDIPQINIKA